MIPAIIGSATAITIAIVGAAWLIANRIGAVEIQVAVVVQRLDNLEARYGGH